MTFKQFSAATELHQVFRSPVLLDHVGLPRYWATAWASLNSRDLAPSTESKKLRYIEALYVFADELNSPGFLDDCLSNCNLGEIGNLLEAYFISLRNREKLTEAAEKQWQTGLGFVRYVVTRISKSSSASDKFAKLESKLLHLDGLYGQLRIQKTRRADTLRSLPADVVGCLYEMLDPESATNPFTRLKTKWTVFVAFVLMLHQGLRRGELLLLPVDAVKSGFDQKKQRERYWLNVRSLEGQTTDPRYNKPSIKTANSIRQVPVSELTANLVQTYTENFRGKADHPFLLNTQWNSPLSHESLTAYFKRLSDSLPKAVLKVLKDRNGKDSVDPHDLRHTCAVVRLNQLLTDGVPMDEALQRTRSFFGWSRESDMPRRYARAVFEDRMADVWAKLQDDRIELLKAIPKGL